ncbi:MAG TPA: PEGA domain-containing protein [Polyangiaceae bacterium]|nr:PEGA domain-containing protein [Polyangiaceae bacterium]
MIWTAKSGLAACLRAVIFVNAICAATPAFAAEDAVVEALIQRGIQLRRNNSDEEALAVFLEAEKQDPTSVRVLLHVVTAAQAAGKWLLADSYMRKVTALESDPYYQRHADAIDVVRRSIAARVGTFQAQGGPDGASVRLDGQLVGTLPMTAPASIEAGAYLMEVHKPGYYRLRRNVTISGGVLTREPVELNRAVARGDLGAGAGTAGAAAAGDVGGEPVERSWWQSPAIGWTFVGLGVASGVGSGIAFATREDRVERWNDDRCIPRGTPTDPEQTRQERCGQFKDQAETAQTIGIVTAVAGAVFAGVGITQLLTSGSSSGSGTVAEDTASSQHGLRVTDCGAGFLTVACRGSF